MIIDKRLKLAIFSGKDRLTKRLDKEQRFFEKWIEKFIFNAIEEAVAKRNVEVRISYDDIPHQFSYGDYFMMSTTEQLSIIKDYLRTVEGLKIEEINHKSIKVTWDLMLDDQLPIPGSTV